MAAEVNVTSAARSSYLIVSTSGFGQHVHDHKTNGAAPVRTCDTSAGTTKGGCNGTSW